MCEFSGPINDGLLSLSVVSITSTISSTIVRFLTNIFEPFADVDGHHTPARLMWTGQICSPEIDVASRASRKAFYDRP